MSKITSDKNKKPRAIAKHYVKNFETLTLAFDNDDLCLMAVLDKEGNPAVLICAVSKDEADMFVFTPLARMLDGDPYSEYQPPI